MRVAFANAEATPVRPQKMYEVHDMKRLSALLLCLMLLLSAAFAETTEDTVIATVNGEDLLSSTYSALESAYLYQYEQAGVDLTDAATYAYIQDLALTYAINQMLLTQDMHAQGCYDLDADTESWCAEQGKSAYNAALNEVIESLRTAESTDDELLVYALAYAASLNVTEQTYVDFYRDQYAEAQYYAWLTRENPVTDEDVQAEYASRVESSRVLYESDVPAFETAMNSGNEVWYRPAGYRRVLQILLPAEGDTEADKLNSVQGTVDEIRARLSNGETFESLIAEYGTDANFDNADFYTTGYQVHQASIIWEDAFVAAAFSADMAQPGCVSQPFASDLGVHILYYLADVPAGAVELTAEISDALHASIYAQRGRAALSVRLEELADAAEVIIR